MNAALLPGRAESAPGSAGISDVLHRVRRHVFAGFYEVWKRNLLGKAFFQFSVLVQTLQLIYLAFVLGERGLWTQGVSDVVILGLRPLSEGVRITASVRTYIGAVACTLCTIWLTAAGFIVIGRDHVRNKPSKSRLVSVVGLSLRLLQTVFLQPVLTVLVRAWACSEVSAEVFTCDAPVSVLKNFVLGVSLITVVHLTLANALFMIQVVPYTTSSAGRLRVDGFRAAHGRVELVVTALRILAIVTVVCIDVAGASMLDRASFSGMEISMLGVLVVSATGLVGTYVYYLPFYDMSWNQLAAVAYCAFLWTTIALVCAHAVRDPSDSSSLLIWVAGLPFTCYVASARVRARMVTLVSTNETLSRNAFVAEIQLRLRHVTPFAGLSGRLPRIEEFAMDGPVAKAYNTALESGFSDCVFFQLLLASWTLVTRKRIVYGLKRIKCAKDLSRQLDHDFALFCISTELREQQGGASGSLSYMEYDKQLHKIKDLVVRSLKLTNEFWSRVANNASMEELVNSGRAISSTSSECRQTVRKLLKISESSTTALRWQATYTAYVLNDLPTAISIMSRCAAEPDSAAQTGYAVCVISADIGSLGKIVEVTEALCQLFGYERSDCLGRNVKMLCPEPFDAVHDRFLRHFLDADTEFATKTRRIYGLHREGFIIPLDFVITPSTTKDADLILIGTFIERRLPEGTHLLLVNAATHIITATSEDAVTALHLQQEDMFSGSLRITDVIPNFFHRDGTHRYKVERDVVYQGQPYGLRSRRLEFASTESSNVKYNVAVYVVNFTLKRNAPADDSELAPTSLRASPSSKLYFAQGQASPKSSKSPSKVSLGVSSDTLGKPAPEAAAPRMRSRDRLAGGDPRRTSNVPSLYSISTVTRDPSKAKRPEFRARSAPSVSFESESVGSGMQESSIPVGKHIEILRRKLVHNLRVQDPIVASFSRFLVKFNVLCIVIASVNTYWVARTYSDFQAEVANIGGILEEGRLLALVPTYVHFASVAPFPNIVGALSAAADRLFELHLEVVTSAQTSLEPVLKSMLYAPTLRSSLDVGNLAIDGTSLYMAVLGALEHVQDILNDAGADADSIECGENCQAVKSLVTMDPIPAAQRIADFYLDRASLQLEYLHQIDQSYLIVTSTLLVLGFVLGFLPLLANVSHQRAKVRSAFLSIPLHMCCFLRSKAHDRHQAIKDGKLPTVARLHNDQIELNNDGETSYRRKSSRIAQEIYANSTTVSGTWSAHFMSRSRKFQPLQDKSGSRRASAAARRTSSAKVTPMSDAPDAPDDDVWLAPATQGLRGSVSSAETFGSRRDTLTRTVSATSDKMGSDTNSGDRLLPGESQQQQPSHEEDDLVPKASTGSRLSRRSSIESARKTIELMSTALSTTPESKLDKSERDFLEICEEYALLGLQRTGRRIKTAFRVGFTLWCMLAHFAFIMTRDGQHMSTMPALAASVHVSGLRFVHVHAIMFWAAQPADESSLSQLEYHLQLAEAYDRALKFGNATLEIEPFDEASGDLFELLFIEACDADCLALSVALANTTQECLAEDLRLGVSFALTNFLGKARRVSAASRALLDADADPSIALLDAFEAAQADLPDLRSQIMLGQGLEQVMRIYTLAIDTAADSVFWEKLMALFVLAALLLLGRMASRSVFRDLDEEITNIKGLLLGLPTEVFTNVPLMYEILKME